MIALLVSRQLGLHAATRLDKHSLVHSVAYLGGMCGDTLLTYAHTAVSQVVHVRLPHLALAHLPSCQVHLLGEAFSISGNLAQAAHTAYTRGQASMQQPCT